MISDRKILITTYVTLISVFLVLGGVQYSVGSHADTATYGTTSTTLEEIQLHKATFDTGSGGVYLEAHGKIFFDVDDDTYLYASADDTVKFYIANANQLTFADGSVVPQTTNDIDLGSSSIGFKEIFTRGIDSDGDNNLVIERNAVDQITFDGTSVQMNLDVDMNGKDLDNTNGIFADGGASFGIHGNKVVGDGTERAIVLRTLNAGSDAWVDAFTITPNGASPTLTVGGDLIFAGKSIECSAGTNCITLNSDNTMNFNTIAVSNLKAGSIVKLDGYEIYGFTASHTKLASTGAGWIFHTNNGSNSPEERFTIGTGASGINSVEIDINSAKINMNDNDIIGKPRIVFYDGAGIPDASNFTTDPDAGEGMEGFIFDTSNDRLYYFADGGVHYISQDGGFSIPAWETEQLGLGVGDVMVLVGDHTQTDGAIHMIPMKIGTSEDFNLNTIYPDQETLEQETIVEKINNLVLDNIWLFIIGMVILIVFKKRGKII